MTTNAIIAINNDYETGTVTASSETTPKENAYDGLLSDYWQPNSGTSHTLDVDMGSAVSVDLFGFYSSNFYTFTGAACKLYHSDGAGYTLAGTITPTTEGPKLKLVTSSSHRYWRLQFDTTAAQQPKIQHAFIGAQVEFERGLASGFEPMALASDQEPINSESVNGVFLGRSTKKKPVATRFWFSNISPAWMRSTWPTIKTALEQKPFMILPAPDTYPDEASYCWTNKAIPNPKMDANNLLQVTLMVNTLST